MKLSELYEMPVEKVGIGARGYVLGAIVNGLKLEYIACCDDDENEYYVRIDRIISLNERILYDSEEKRKRKEKPFRLGTLCLDERGRILGRLEDIFIKNYSLKSAQINGRKYAFDRLVRGDVIIVRDKKNGDAAASIAARDMFIDAVCS